MEPQSVTVAFIPVRGGSKSIPLKNIMPLAGRPLLYWTLDAALGSNHIDRIYVSTDSGDIARAVESYRDNLSLERQTEVQCIGRSAQTATDTASTESAMLEFAQNYQFDKIILIQATSPLLTSFHLDQAIYKYDVGKFDSMLSLVRQKRFIWREDVEGFVEPVNYDPLTRPRRQEMDGFLVENGSFYITSRPGLLDTGCRLSGRIGFYEMPEETYFEIDEPSDWIIVEQLLKQKTRQSFNQSLQEKLQNIKLVALDCDGVLTDGGMYYSDDGSELKKFNTRDGMGISLLHQKGIKTAIITGEDIALVKRRADKLKVDYVYLGIKDKLAVIQEIMGKENITLEEVAFIGDDINDLPAMRQVGVKFSVNDAMDTVKSIADYVSHLNGGRGAVREIAELIILSKNKPR